jgi:hypothetical protein
VGVSRAGTLNTLAPPSLAALIILGVWISTNPFLARVSLNSWHTPASSLKMAWLVGVLRSSTRLSSLVSWLTLAKFPSSSSVTFLAASSICRGNCGSLAETTHTFINNLVITIIFYSYLTWFTCNSTSCWVQLSIVSSTFLTTASTSTMLSLDMLKSRLNLSGRHSTKLSTYWAMNLTICLLTDSLTKARH